MIADLEDAAVSLDGARSDDPVGAKVVSGATVTLLDEDEKKVKYQLVGQAEADVGNGRISYNSPLGRALIGRQVGDESGLDPFGRSLLRDRKSRSRPRGSPHPQRSEAS